MSEEKKCVRKLDTGERCPFSAVHGSIYCQKHKLDLSGKSNDKEINRYRFRDRVVPKKH